MDVYVLYSNRTFFGARASICPLNLESRLIWRNMHLLRPRVIGSRVAADGVLPLQRGILIRNGAASDFRCRFGLAEIATSSGFPHARPHARHASTGPAPWQAHLGRHVVDGRPAVRQGMRSGSNTLMSATLHLASLQSSGSMGHEMGRPQLN